jgi:hypothetical protein
MVDQMQALGYKFGQGGVVAPTLALFKSSVGALKMTDKRICSIDNCYKPAAKGRRICEMHRSRKRSGKNMLDPHQTVKGSGASWIETHKGHAGDDCLAWPFGVSSNGYGSVNFHGKATTASRAMCIAAHGEPTARGMDAAHSCGNGHNGCVNPNHLRWATRAENIADMIDHGTANRGEIHGRAKLSETQAREIMALKGKMLQKEIAKMFGVSRANISFVHSKNSWGHLWE